MSDTESRIDTKIGSPSSGTHPSDESRSSDPPPSSRRGFIGTNIDKAQAYVPPTELSGTPEPPVPVAKVALSEGVDPRKLPTTPNLKKAAQAIAAELQSERPPPPSTPPPPDSQASGIRRGAGYAPTRNDPIPRATPAKGLRLSGRVSTPPPEPRSQQSLADNETSAQRSTALFLIFLFAAMLAVAVYFFLRRAPAPGEALSGSGVHNATPLSAAPVVSAAPSAVGTTSAAPSISAPEPAPSVDVTPPPSTTVAPGSAGSTAAPRPSVTAEASATPTVPAVPSNTSAPSNAPTAAPSASGPNSGRWF
ncbi:MAG: hypothetical protein IPK82_05510 [Polyangiaceae bacterium]|nr:hypothetical protein [Polyangiaceae bacterium]